MELKAKDKARKKNFRVFLEQSEKLLPAIASFLAGHKINLEAIKKIKASSRGESFTSLRIGVSVANGLAYGLGLIGPEKIIKPLYSCPPRITLKKER